MSMEPVDPGTPMHSEAPSEGLERGLRETFFFMEKRRLQRTKAGFQVKQGLIGAAMEAFFVFAFSIYVLSSIPSNVVRSEWILWATVCLTVGIVVYTLYHSFMSRDNTLLTWSKTFCWLFVIWMIYSGETSEHDHLSGDSRFILEDMSDSERTVFQTFCGLQAAMFCIWVIMYIVWPRVTYCFFYGECGLHAFWAIRLSLKKRAPNKYSYKPHGRLCTIRRRHFRYWGDRNHGEQPHGLGIWHSDCYHGEILKGMWQDGIPTAPFMSRTFGNGALSAGLRIGYGTSRAEGFSELYWLPQRQTSTQLRYGTVAVECSIAGGFMSHLPEVLQHKPCESSYSAVTALKGAADSWIAMESADPCGGASSNSLARDIEANDDGGGMDTLVSIPSLSRSVTASMLGKTAIVYVHGYNCPLEHACLRLGQLLTLGQFNPDILPFIYSWSTGSTFMFFPVRQRVKELAEDLPAFLVDLHRAGIQEVHILAHSIGCEIVTAVLPDLLTLQGPAGAAPGLKFPTITLLNATNPCDEFICSGGDLSRILALPGIERVTLYCDKEDIALLVAETFARYAAVGRVAPDAFMNPDREISGREKVDVIDCSAMDANVHNIRHSYFDLNVSVVGDLQQLMSQRKPAARRNRLVRVTMDRRCNVFAFLAPPVFLTNS